MTRINSKDIHMAAFEEWEHWKESKNATEKNEYLPTCDHCHHLFNGKPKLKFLERYICKYVLSRTSNGKSMGEALDEAMGFVYANLRRCCPNEGVCSGNAALMDIHHFLTDVVLDLSKLSNEFAQVKFMAMISEAGIDLE